MDEQIEYNIAKIKDGEKFYQMNYQDQIWFGNEIKEYFEQYMGNIYPELNIDTITIDPESNVFDFTIDGEINKNIIEGALNWEYIAKSYSSSVNKYWYSFRMEDRL